MEGKTLKTRFDPENPMKIGGQAVLEGVMMRAPGMVATAVRRANGEIAVKKEPYVSLAERSRLFRLPILRGAVGLVEMMVIGIRTLNYSAEVALHDAESAQQKNGVGQDAPVIPRSQKSRPRESLKLAMTVMVSLLVGIAIFFVTPLFVTTTLFALEQDAFLFNLTAGGIRVGLLLAYLVAISLMKEINRLFQYHGAEHKAVFACEYGEELLVPAAALQSRFHPRCGTSFLLIVMIISIFLFSMLDAFLITFLGPIDLGTRLLTHLPLIPLVGGVSYEIIKISAKHSDTLGGRMASAPGLWLQRITTKEPDERQLEVALVALRCALGEDITALPAAGVSAPQSIVVN